MIAKTPNIRCFVAMSPFFRCSNVTFFPLFILGLPLFQIHFQSTFFANHFMACVLQLAFVFDIFQMEGIKVLIQRNNTWSIEI